MCTLLFEIWSLLGAHCTLFAKLTKARRSEDPALNQYVDKYGQTVIQEHGHAAVTRRER